MVTMKALQRSHRKNAEEVCVVLSYLKDTHIWYIGYFAAY